MKNWTPVGDGKSVPSRAYEQILSYIGAEDIVGSKLPPETEFAELLGVSRTALREALQRLEAEGYISRQRRVGTIVLAKRRNLDAGLEKLDSLTQTIESSGMKPGTLCRHWRREPANSLIAKMLDIKVGTEVTVFERVRTADDIRLCYDINFIPVEFITEKDEDKLGESLLSYLSTKHGPIHQSLAYLHPYTADSMVSEKLQIPSGHLVMLLEHTNYGPEGGPVWYSRTFHRSDVISFHIVRSP
ncbi:MAG: GntR family transcriptional regulator [Limnochordia bacterium]|nr:GntR family transcriptional regulator [Bacillota bacterium]